MEWVAWLTQRRVERLKEQQVAVAEHIAVDLAEGQVALEAGRAFVCLVSRR
jgi:hypothetical protein